MKNVFAGHWQWGCFRLLMVRAILLVNTVWSSPRGMLRKGALEASPQKLTATALWPEGAGHAPWGKGSCPFGPSSPTDTPVEEWPSGFRWEQAGESTDGGDHEQMGPLSPGPEVAESLNKGSDYNVSKNQGQHLCDATPPQLMIRDQNCTEAATYHSTASTTQVPTFFFQKKIHLLGLPRGISCHLY